jgi:hypothetical protein
MGETGEAAAMSDLIDSTYQAPDMESGLAQTPEGISALLSALGEQILPPKLYRIGEVMEHSGFSRQTIHNYTAMGLIRESRWTEKGHRLYDADVFRYLALIKHLKNRFSLAQIKRMLDQVPAS